MRFDTDIAFVAAVVFPEWSFSLLLRSDVLQHALIPCFMQQYCVSRKQHLVPQHCRSTAQHSPMFPYVQQIGVCELQQLIIHAVVFIGCA